MATRLHQVLVKAVVEVLQRSMFDNEHAGIVIADVLKQNSKFGSKDRRFIAETSQEVLRNFRLLAALSNQDYQNPQTNLWHVFACWLLLQETELPAWEEFDGIKDLKLADRLAQLEKTELLSMPTWLYDLGKAQLGERLDIELKAMLQPAHLVLRVNTSKVKVDTLKRKLLAQGIENVTVDEAPDALVLAKKRNLQDLKEFTQGMFEVQDAGSQLVAPMLQVQPGLSVIDACAGAGGKSLHLADLMENQGKIIALDVAKYKINNLKLRLKRARFRNIESYLINDEIIERFNAKADRLLLDVPCSGLGVLKRSPDTKWKLTQTELDDLVVTQRSILSQYNSMLKPGGLMLYVTCSILPMENEQQIQWFLTENKSFTLVEERHVWPSEFGFDGFYMALLQKA